MQDVRRGLLSRGVEGDDRDLGSIRLANAGVAVTTRESEFLGEPKAKPQPPSPAQAAKMKVAKASQGSFNLMGLMDNLLYGKPIKTKEARTLPHNSIVPASDPFAANYKQGFSDNENMVQRIFSDDPAVQRHKVPLARVHPEGFVRSSLN
mmetsp:Transcript_26233/g.60562  ORF Transcript_26233/g.60562 Transcript_26233/m.60562 type:complete len:150 (-) Transcript_26233:117-566(-)